MKIVTTLITENYGLQDIVAILDGPSTAGLLTLRMAFRDAYGFPTWTQKDIETWSAAALRQDEDAAMERAAFDLGVTHETLGGSERDPGPRCTEAFLFVRWLMRDHGFTKHPITTFHYDDEEED